MSTLLEIQQAGEVSTVQVGVQGPQGPIFTGALLAANNLGDVQSSTTALANIGGVTPAAAAATAATTAATAAAQAQYQAQYANCLANGYAAWSFDPCNSYTGNTLTFISANVQPSGVLRFYLFYLPCPVTIQGYMASGWRQYSGTVGSNAYFGLFQWPTGWVPGVNSGTITRVGNSSPDMSASSYGPNPQNIGAAGTLAAGWYGFGCVVGAQASAGVGPEYNAGTASGVLSHPGYGLTAQYATGGQTSLPSTLLVTQTSYAQASQGFFAIY